MGGLNLLDHLADFFWTFSNPVLSLLRLSRIPELFPNLQIRQICLFLMILLFSFNKTLNGAWRNKLLFLNFPRMGNAELLLIMCTD